jgi:hypothetical protein
MYSRNDKKEGNVKEKKRNEGELTTANHPISAPSNGYDSVGNCILL